MKEEIDKKVAKLLLGFENGNLKKLLKEMGKGNKFYKTFNDSKILSRKLRTY
jgi:hypothetical protein